MADKYRILIKGKEKTPEEGKGYWWNEIGVAFPRKGKDGEPAGHSMNVRLHNQPRDHIIIVPADPPKNKSKDVETEEQAPPPEYDDIPW